MSLSESQLIPKSVVITAQAEASKFLRHEISEITAPYVTALRSKAAGIESIEGNNQGNSRIGRETIHETRMVIPGKAGFWDRLMRRSPKAKPTLVDIDVCRAGWDYETDQWDNDYGLNYKSFQCEIELIKLGAQVRPKPIDSEIFLSPMLELQVADDQIHVVRFFFGKAIRWNQTKEEYESNPAVEAFNSERDNSEEDLGSLLTGQARLKSDEWISMGIDFELEKLSMKIAQYAGGSLGYGNLGASRLGDWWFHCLDGQQVEKRIQGLDEPKLFLDSLSTVLKILDIESFGKSTPRMERNEVDLEERAKHRSFLQGFHDLTGRALDLLRPAQGSTRPSLEKTTEPFSARKYQ